MKTKKKLHEAVNATKVHCNLQGALLSQQFTVDVLNNSKKLQEV